MAKFFKTPFALEGDRALVPTEAQVSGKVSYTTGYTPDYSKDLRGGDPDAKPVERTSMNAVFHDITEALGFVQAHGAADWSAEGKPYAVNAIVRHSDKNWVSLIPSNNATPIEGSSWTEFSAELLKGKLDKTAVKTVTGTSATDVMSQKAVTDAVALKLDKASVKTTTGTSATDVMSQKAVTDAVALKLDKASVKTTTGTSTTDVMSQKAVTDAVALKLDKASVKTVTGTSATDVMSQKAVTDAVALKLDRAAVKQVPGESTTDVMSQRGVKTALDLKADKSQLGNSASLNVGTFAGTVAAGDDARILGAIQKTAVKQVVGYSATDIMSQKAVTDALSLMTPIANNIGVAGQIGFGVGICPLEYDGMSEMLGTRIFGHDNYGNYQYSDGSVMAWVPAYFYRYGHPNNPTYATYGVNSVDVLPRHAYPTILAAAVAGYAFHRAFWDDGVEQPGVFVDKYLCSNNEGVASSVKNGNAITSSAAHYPFSGLTGSPANNFSGAITAVKTRGADFFAATPFIPGMLALLSLAHGQLATSDAACAWYSASTTNFPKGCNNNALGDSNDASVAYTSTGHETYPNCGKTGSGLPFAKTTHNGQACGVADINGLLWEINPGLTFLDGNYYILSPDARAADLTPGLTLPTDAWGATGLAASHLLVGPSIGALGSNPAGATLKVGSANQVLSSATEGIEWAAAGAGIPQLDGVGGTNLFGNDGFYDNQPAHMCTAAGGYWYHTAFAGPWARSCFNSRASAGSVYGVRAALYLVKRSDSE